LSRGQQRPDVIAQAAGHRGVPAGGVVAGAEALGRVESVLHEVNMGGTAIGTLRVADGTISNFNGVVYVQVNDLPAACEKARELGGTIPPVFPFNLPDGTGAIALLSDPAGHPIGMYSNTLLPSASPPAK
jgi:predicted enzyme related to lactoylglutathione lyase